MKKLYVEVEASQEHLDIEEYTQEVRFVSKDTQDLEVELLNTIEELCELNGIKGYEEALVEVLANSTAFANMNFDLIDMEVEPYDRSEVKDIVSDIMEYGDIEIVKEVASKLGITVSIVNTQSTYDYAVYLNGNESFVGDLYRGYNFYDVTIHEEVEVGKTKVLEWYDSYHFVYSPKNEDLVNIIKFATGDNEVALIKNDTLTYLDLPFTVGKIEGVE